MEEKDKHKLNQIYLRIPAHDTKIVVGNFNAKTGREDFMPLIQKRSLHETSNENGTKATDFAATATASAAATTTPTTTNNMIIESPYFPHNNIHTENWQSPDKRTNTQIDLVLVDGRHESSIIDVRSCRGVDYDLDHHLV
jgi:hypothetical protein